MRSMAKIAVMSQALLSDIFKYYTARGFVLYRLSLDPPRTYTISPWDQPAVVKEEPGWEEKLRQQFLDYDIGQITNMKPLPTLESIISEGSEYLTTMLNAVNGELVKEQFGSTA